MGNKAVQKALFNEHYIDALPSIKQLLDENQQKLNSKSIAIGVTNHPEKCRDEHKDTWSSFFVLLYFGGDRALDTLHLISKVIGEYMELEKAHTIVHENWTFAEYEDQSIYLYIALK